MPVNRILACIAALGAFILVLPSPASSQTRSVTLEWTAPGDDGYIGKATAYEIRFSRYPITPQNFVFAVRLNTALLPGPVGTHERMTVFGLQYGIPYYFALRAYDDAGNLSQISNVAYLSPGVAEVDGQAALEPQFAAPHPNPVRSSTMFAVTMPKSDQLRVEAFDISGRKVRTIAQGQYSGGTFNLKWDLRADDGHPLQAGAYLVRGQLGESVFLRRVNVIR